MYQLDEKWVVRENGQRTAILTYEQNSNTPQSTTQPLQTHRGHLRGRRAGSHSRGNETIPVPFQRKPTHLSGRLQYIPLDHSWGLALGTHTPGSPFIFPTVKKPGAVALSRDLHVIGVQSAFTPPPLEPAPARRARAV